MLVMTALSCLSLLFQGCSSTRYTFHKGPVLSAEEYNDLGVAYESNGEYQLAVDSYNRAIEVNKEYLIAWMNLGNVYNKMNIFKKAERAYQQALQINPSSGEAQNNLAWLYIENKQDIEQAIMLSERCASTPSAYQSYCLDTLGMAYYYHGDSAKAIEHVTQAIQVTPFENKILLSQQYYHLGIIHLSKKERENASEYLQQSIEFEPEGEWAKKAQEEINRLNTMK